MKNILTPLQKKVLKAVGQSPLGKSYVWTGGTALAYRLKHRFSEDLDFFSIELDPSEVFLAHLRKIQKICGLLQKHYEEKLNRRMFVFFKGKETLKMKFVYFPFLPLKKPARDPKRGIRIDSIEEIAVNKVLSAFERREPKDAYDLFILWTKKGFDLKSLIKKVEKKFGVKIDYASLVSKLLASAKKISILKPLLLKKEKDLPHKMYHFFQAKGNRYLRLMML